LAHTLLERSLLTMPGSYLGQGGEGHLRVSLTPTAARVARAAEVLGAGAITLAADARSCDEREV
jgi:aspartate/methionine/tyrosine aminotransferase